MQHRKRAFTMIELLFVIVILGIIGGIALEAIRQYFQGIYRTQVYTQRVNDADHILDQVSKYFENSIDLSIVNLDQDAADGALVGTCAGDPHEEAEAVAHDYTVGMIGVDVDSLRTVGKPGWSEHPKTNWFPGQVSIDLNYSDSNLTRANATITALYPTSNLLNSAIYDYRASNGGIGSCSNFNWDNSGGLNSYFTITNVAGNIVTVINNNVSEDDSNTPLNREYLLRTGYAFRVLNSGEFVMFSNFRPWKGEKYNTGKRSTLGKNVASFYADFNNTNSHNDRGSVWRLKVCMQGLNSELNTTNIASQAICRERRVHVRY